MYSPVFLQFGVPLLLVIGLLFAVECGYRLGERRVRGSDAGKAMETGAIQGAMLGLLGLLLGFSFAGASGRYMERQDLIATEANSISTAYLRADLLDAPYDSALRTALRNYVEHRVEASASLQRGLMPEVAREITAHHSMIWATAIAGVDAKPLVTVPVLGPVNELLDRHSLRIAASRKHLPGLVLALLTVCSLLTLGVIGYACALARRRNTVLTAVIAVLVGAALWTTIDLDYGRIGLIQLSDAPLIDLQDAMRAPERDADVTPAAPASATRSSAR
ncbi:MAG: hypothetical protein ACF8QF_03890 [Phycisphaerales bacterium]